MDLFDGEIDVELRDADSGVGPMPGSSSHAPPRQSAKVACNPCRGLKMRCLRSAPDVEPDGPCDRCKRMSRECTVPPYRKPGRVKGAKNKYKGVDKALRQIHSELRKARQGSSADPGRSDLLKLVAKAEGLSDDSHLLSSLLAAQARQDSPDYDIPAESTSSSVLAPPASAPDTFHSSDPEGTAPSQLDHYFLLKALDQGRQQRDGSCSPSHNFSHLIPGSPGLPSPSSLSPHDHSSHQPSQSISNPLGLLAEASEAVRPSVSFSHNPLSTRANAHFAPPGEHHLFKTSVTDMLKAGPPIDSRIASLGLSWESASQGLLAITSPSRSPVPDSDLDFFRPKVSGHTRGDLGPENDPLDLAILTEEEADTFFNVFYAHLHPLVAVLDPTLHTPAFVRRRSSFLFSAICFSGAQFTPGAGQVMKRLLIHSERLAKRIVSRGWKSLEICQGFLIWLPWLPPPERLYEDRSWLYTSYAMVFMTELGLDRPLSADWSADKIRSMLGPDLEGMDASDPLVLERMIRNRERLHLRFFLWESASAVAFGRGSSACVETELIKREDWHVHRLALPYDKETSAICRLRRYVISLSTEIKHRLANNPSQGTDWIRGFIDAALDPWYRKWLSDPTLEAGSSLPSVYVELLYRAGRLWCLSMGLQHRSSSAPEQRTEAPQIVNDCLVGALETCQTALTGLQSSRFCWKIPNTVFPLLSWAACLSMRLFDCNVGFDGFFTSTSHLLGLLANLALVLVEVGSTPSHRRGTAAIYGRHLQLIVRARVMAVWKLHSEQAESAAAGLAPETLTIVPGTMTPLGAEGAGAIPLSGWPTEWWTSNDVMLPWGEDMLGQLGSLGSDENIF